MKVSHEAKSDYVIYRKTFQSSINDKVNRFSFNIDEVTRNILIEELIKSAKNCIQILCNDLDSIIWNDHDIANAVRDARKRNIAIDIVCDKNDTWVWCFGARDPNVHYHFGIKTDMILVIADNTNAYIQPSLNITSGFATTNGHKLGAWIDKFQDCLSHSIPEASDEDIQQLRNMLGRWPQQYKDWYEKYLNRIFLR